MANQLWDNLKKQGSDIMSPLAINNKKSDTKNEKNSSGSFFDKYTKSGFNIPKYSKAQTSSNAQMSSPVPKPTNVAMPADTLQTGAKPVDLTGINQKFEDFSSSLTGLQSQIATYSQEQEDAKAAAGKKDPNAMPDYMQNYFDSLQSDVTTGTANVGTAEDLTTTAQEGYDAAGAVATQSQQELDILHSQAQDIVAQAKQAQLTLESQAAGKDVTTAFLGRQQQEIGRQAAIQALPLQSQILAKQAVVTGNMSLLKMATDKLNKAFEVQEKHETNLYNYKRDLRNAVYGYMTVQEQAKSNAQAKQEEREYQEKRDALTRANDIADKASENGQYDLAAQITALDSSSSTYTQDVAALQKQIVEKVDPMEALKMETIRKQNILLDKQISSFGQLSPEQQLERQAEEDAQLQEAASSIQVVNKKMNTIEALLGDQYQNALKKRVGTSSHMIAGGFGDSRQSTNESLWGLTATVENFWSGASAENTFGQGNAFAGFVKNLTSGLTLNELQEAKARGATFGALSNAELQILAESATAISQWEIKEWRNGEQVGMGVWNVDEKTFKQELRTIYHYLQAAKTRDEKKLISDSERNSFNEIFNEHYQGQDTDVSLFY
ncbi:MAG: hypothetical protein GY861_18075 [bacterium]|nr:hypothetical protein [bacterium]